MVSTTHVGNIHRAGSRLACTAGVALACLMIVPAARAQFAPSGVVAHARTHTLFHHGRKTSESYPQLVKEPPPPPPPSPILEIGNVDGCRIGADPRPVMRLYPQASTIRIIVNPNTYRLGALNCADTAAAEGYRVHLVIQWWDWMTPAQVATYYGLVLAKAPPAWAISVGNEQEIGIGGGGPLSPRQYADVWASVEPLIAAAQPHAIRVAGEVAPWSNRFFGDIAWDNLPGVQALAAHAFSNWAPVLPTDFCVMAARHKLRVWFDEGLRVQGAWRPDWTRPEADLKCGAVVGAWL